MNNYVGFFTNKAANNHQKHTKKKLLFFPKKEKIPENIPLVLAQDNFHTPAQQNNKNIIIIHKNLSTEKNWNKNEYNKQKQTKKKNI
jgi:hypothetical protein